MTHDDIKTVSNNTKNTQSHKVNNIDSKCYVMREMSISVFPNIYDTISSHNRTVRRLFCGILTNIEI